MLGVSILSGCYNLSSLSCEYLWASIVCSCYYRGSTAVKLGNTKSVSARH